MTARSMMLLVAAMAVAALAVGCGSGSDSEDGSDPAATTVTTSSLPKAAFVKQASAICERDRGVIIGAQGKSFSKIIEVTMVPAFENLVEEVRALGAPRGEEAQVEAFLSAMQQDTDALAERRESISSFAQAEDQFKGSAAVARKSGLPKCAFFAKFPSS